MARSKQTARKCLVPQRIQRRTYIVGNGEGLTKIKIN